MATAPSPLLGLPPQSAPPLMGLAPLTPDGKSADLSKALFTTTLWLFLYNVQQTFSSVPRSGGSSEGGVADQALASGMMTTITPAYPAKDGLFLTYFVQAKGPTGGLAWGASTRWAPTELDSTLDTWTVFEFVSRIDPNDSLIRWFYVGPSPVTGEPT